MNSELKETNQNLGLLISEKACISLMEAKRWQWHVLNEYPDDIAELVIAWANDRPLPHVEYNGLSIEHIINGTEASVLDAADLLYIVSKDPGEGIMIFQRSIRFDRIKNSGSK